MTSLCHIAKKTYLGHQEWMNLYLPAHFNTDDLVSQKSYN